MVVNDGFDRKPSENKLFRKKILIKRIGGKRFLCEKGEDGALVSSKEEMEKYRRGILNVSMNEETGRETVVFSVGMEVDER